MTRPDDHIRALVDDLRAVHAEAEAAVDRFRALQPGRRLRVADVGPSWSEWLASPDGAAYRATVERFEVIAGRLIDARPESLLAYCVKLEGLSLADLDEDDMQRLAQERAEIISAGEGGAA